MPKSSEYKVLEAKNIEAFREQVVQEGAQGWQVISRALSPTFYAVLEDKG